MNWMDIRRKLHQIPEEGFKEYKTQAFLLECLKKLNQERLFIKTWRTGILVKIKGSNPKKTIGYRCDMDGLPIKEETNVWYESNHEGFMHACGHDFHMTIALRVVHYFTHHESEDDIVVIFQPAEEGPGGALLLVESEEFKEYKPDIIFALHIAPELPVGTVSAKPGVLFANCSELYVTFKGQSAHGARPHLGNDMVIAASHFITQLQSVVSRSVDPLDSSVVTIGKLIAGNRNNIISDKAHLEGTLRSLTEDNMKVLKKRVSEIAKGIQTSFDCELELAFKHDYVGVYNHEKETEDFKKFVETQNEITYIEATEAMTAEDFGFFLKEIPGFMFWLGAESDHGLHTPQIQPKEELIDIGSKIVIDYIKHIGG